ncbi:hypothetical protein EMCG_02111 [[Emmonsia] crescens]|uniref:Uncharacterized protein n=1 Tax=[Emmonsia] crescens TaxID=73230 RepID=A0A0G2J1W2_9EURO|nr:hypothetical protein EMCG_02111 [Emmonsia crescens UAMH 3008]
MSRTTQYASSSAISLYKKNKTQKYKPQKCLPVSIAWKRDKSSSSTPAVEPVIPAPKDTGNPQSPVDLQCLDLYSVRLAIYLKKNVLYSNTKLVNHFWQDEAGRAENVLLMYVDTNNNHNDNNNKKKKKKEEGEQYLQSMRVYPEG